MKKRNPPRNIHLLSIYEELIRHVDKFQLISFQHIYLERNEQAYELAKIGLPQIDGM